MARSTTSYNLGLHYKRHIALDLQRPRIQALARIAIVDALLAVGRRGFLRVRLHAKVLRVGVDARVAARAGPVSLGAAVADLAAGAGAPGLQVREDVAEQGPDGGQVRDVHGDGGFAEVPVHVHVGDERGHQAVDLGQDGGDDDEEAHAEDHEQDGLLLQGQADRGEDGDADEEDGDVAWDAQGALDDFVVLVCGALCWRGALGLVNGGMGGV